MASLLLSARATVATLVRPSAARHALRFQQTAANAKPNQLKTPLECVNEQETILIDGRHVYCNGGDAVGGHPRVWINLDKPYTMACGYCGVRYAQKHLVEKNGGPLPLYTAV